MASASFKNGSVVESQNSTATSAGTLTLTSASDAYQIFTGTANHTVVLPDATTLIAGQKFEVVNTSTGSITVNANGGGSIGSVSAGATAVFRIVDISTSAGSWDSTAGSSGGVGGLSSNESSQFSALAAIGFTATSKPIKFFAEEMGGNYWITKTSVTLQKTWAATFGLNGFVYNTGGIASGTDVATTERYTDDGNYWLSRTSQTTARDGSVAQVISSKGYVTGGLTGGSATASAVHEEYTDSTNAWATKTAYPIALYGMSCFSIGGIGYVAGGLIIGPTYHNEVYAYDPTANAWYLRSPITTSSGRNAGSDGNYKDNGYVFGGSNTSGRVEKYSTSANTWTTAKTMANIQAFAALMVMNGSVTIAGGESATGTNTNVVENYIDTIDAWTTVASAGNSVDTNGCSLNGFGLKIAGGTGSSSHVSLVEQYTNTSLFNLGALKKSNVAINSLAVSVILNSLTPNVPVQLRTDGDAWKTFLSEGSALKLNESLSTKFVESGLPYFVGGDTSGSTASAVVEFYNDQANTWTTRQPITAAVYFAATFQLNGLGYIAGGAATGSSNVNTNYQYNELTNTFATKATTPIQLHGNSGFALHGFGYSAGGANNTPATINTTYKYNPTTDAWATASGVLGSSRSANHGMTNLDRGWTAGGYSGGYLSISESYNDVTDAWSSITNLSTAVASTQNFALNSALYVCGGETGSTSSGTQTYNAQTNAWSSAASLPGAQEAGAGVRANGFGYSISGSNNATPTASVSATYKYADGANTWSTKANVNTTRFYAMCMTPGNFRNYEVRVAIPTFYAGLGGGVWVSKGALPTTRSDANGFALNGNVFALGGQVASNTITANVEKYTQATDVWTSYVPMLISNWLFGHGSLYGLGYTMGTDNASDTSFGSATYQLDPILAAWATKTSLTTTRRAPASAVLNGSLYAFGGYNGSDLSSIEKYNAFTNSWSSGGSLLATSRALEGCTSGGYALLFGGIQSSSFVVNSYQYNDAITTVTSIANMPSAHSNLLPYTIQDKIIITGRAGQSFNTMEYLQQANIYVLKSNTAVDRNNGGGGVIGDAGMAFGGLSGSSSSFTTTSEMYVNSVKQAVLSAGIAVS